jgi:hypothetical protein
MFEYLIYHINVFPVRDLERAETPVKNETTTEVQTSVIQETSKATSSATAAKVENITEKIAQVDISTGVAQASNEEPKLKTKSTSATNIT